MSMVLHTCSLNDLHQVPNQYRCSPLWLMHRELLAPWVRAIALERHDKVRS
jgi:hypothetical protein